MAKLRWGGRAKLRLSRNFRRQPALQRNPPKSRRSNRCMAFICKCLARSPWCPPSRRQSAQTAFQGTHVDGELRGKPGLGRSLALPPQSSSSPRPRSLIVSAQKQIELKVRAENLPEFPLQAPAKEKASTSMIGERAREQSYSVLALSFKNSKILAACSLVGSPLPSVQP
jgi:hypothetical protein